MLNDVIDAVETILRIDRAAEGRTLTHAQAADRRAAREQLQAAWRHLPARFGSISDYEYAQEWQNLLTGVRSLAREQDYAPMSNHPHVERLRLERGELAQELRAILAAPERESRELNADEERRWNAANAEIAEIDAKIASFNAQEARVKAADEARRPHASVLSSDSRAMTPSLSTALFGEVSEFRSLFDYSGGGTAVARTQYSSTIWEHLAGQAVVLNAPGITRYTTSESSFSITGGTSFVTASAVAEGGTATPVDPGYVRHVVAPEKFVAFTKASEEFWSDSGEPIRAQIANNLIRSLALEISREMLEGDGSPGLTGIKNITGVGNVDGGSAVVSDLSFFAQAIGTAMAANATPTAWVMGPEMYGKLIGLTEGTALNRPLLTPAVNAGGAPVMTAFGLPILVAPSGAISGGTSVFLLSAPEIVAVQRTDFSISINPYLEFDSGIIGVKATARIGMVVPNPASQVVITDLKFA